MALGRQIAVLTHKNLLVIWRSKLWFVAEMFFGLLLLPPIIFIVSKAQSDLDASNAFDSVPISGDRDDIPRYVKTITTIRTKMCNKNLKLAFYASNYVGQQMINEFKLRYAEDLPSIVHVEVEQFDSLIDMKEALMDDLNITREKICGQYMGGVHIIEADVMTHRFSYRIYHPLKHEAEWYLGDFWPTEGPYSAVSDLNSIPGQPNWWQSGFLSFQLALDSLFLKHLNYTPPNVILQRMPTPEFRNNSVVAFLRATPFLFLILVLFTMVHTTKEIVSEKEAGIKTYLMVMGMDSIIFYISHFIIALIKIFIIVSLCCYTLSLGFLYVSWSLFVALSLVYGMAAIVFSILISVIFRKPALAIASVVMIWFGLGILDYFLKPSLSNVEYCMLNSLNIFTAYRLGVQAASGYETRLMHLGWLNMFSDTAHQFSIGLSFVMLFIDLAIMTFLIFYLDAVVPTDDSPRKSPFFILPFWKSTEENLYNIKDEDEPDTLQNESVEPDGQTNLDEADIDVQKLTKVWESTGQVAVDNMSFRAFRGQVTVLLGHNGAGKTTTFSVISGVTTSTMGNVFICKHEISHDLNYCQKQIGYCPQYNPLFNKLTVAEHLRFYDKLKDGNQVTREVEIDGLLHDVQLFHKKNELAENLSGGMKRKLCVAMSLVANSRVVLLDEPTAGMDPEARHDVCQLLARKKKDKTILLTTHYMDEADLLGDRIAIMVKGRLVCYGSSSFLKNKFGTGYVLTIVMNLDNTNLKHIHPYINGILKTVSKHAPDARLEKTFGQQFSVILPAKYKSYFSNLFEELEDRKDELSIRSFGLSFNTLEQVFLRVGELADPNDDQIDSSVTLQNAAALYGNITKYTGKKVVFWTNQLIALLRRHFLNALRNKVRTILPIIISFLLFSLFAAAMNYSQVKKMTRDITLLNTPPIFVPIMLDDSRMRADFPFMVNKMPQAQILTLSPYDNLTELLIRHALDVPPLGIGIKVMKNDTIMALFNGMGYHAPPLVLNLISNAIVKEEPTSIQASIELYELPPSEIATKAMSILKTGLVLPIILIMAFAFLTSTFVMPLIEERQSRFKHQILLTELHVVLYWVSVTLWFLFVYVLFCLMLTLVLHFSGWVEGCFFENILLWSLYFWSCIPFVYCTSFLFTSAVKGFAGLICYQTIVAIIALITVGLVNEFGTEFFKTVTSPFFALFIPSYSLGHGMWMVSMQCSIAQKVLVWTDLNRVVFSMLASGFIFWFILTLVQSHRVAIFFHRLKCQFRPWSYSMVDDDINEDEDVAQERERIRMLDDREQALAVRGVYKYYGNLCAVRNLSFGVNPTDCFGLLGVNGAGKTTTFDIITGGSFATRGRATVGGVDVLRTPVIGYCPQFDALAKDLTGRETLQLLARLNGFEDVNSRVEKVLASIHMTALADKLVQYYSGGQKRRLSIGVTLMARTSLIMLDEPTAGIDPKTRRHIWNLLSAIRQQKIAILLTSHSMDECEALCSRIGFMNKGSLMSIGTSQHLKSRYGNTFLLTFTVANPSPAVCHCLDTIVVKEFGANPTQDAPTMCTLHWELPRRANDRWSALYRRAQKIAENYPESARPPPGSEIPLIKDFSVTQNSLEQVFLRLTELCTTEEDK